MPALRESVFREVDGLTIPNTPDWLYCPDCAVPVEYKDGELPNKCSFCGSEKDCVNIHVVKDALKKFLSQNSPHGFEPKVLVYQDFLSDGDAEQPWTVSDLIPKPGFTILAGAPGSCKTFFALEIAVMVASGGKCFGHFPTAEKAGVLIIDEENNPNEIRKRLKKLGHADAKLDIFFMNYQGFSFDRQECRDYLTDFLAQRPNIKLIIADSLRRVSRFEENKSDEVSGLLDRMKAYCEEFGVSWLLLHHLRKPMQGMKSTEYSNELRGSGDLVGFVDNVLILNKTRRGDETKLTLYQTKNRYAPEIPAQEFKLAEDKEAGTLQIDWVGEVQEKELLVQIIARELLAWNLSEGKSSFKTGEAKAAMLNKKYADRTTDDALAWLAGNELCTKLKKGVYMINPTKAREYLGFSAKAENGQKQLPLEGK